MDDFNFAAGTMAHLAALLKEQPPIHIGEWQSKDTSKLPQMATHELTDIVFMMNVPDTQDGLVKFLGEDLNQSWADEHFAERVGGVPLNPPPSHKNWPWAKYNGNHQNDTEQFSHTYPERMWPRHAGNDYPVGYNTSHNDPNRGIRFDYGDLQDVVDLMVRSPLTRQAYLPIWFPEDTGAHHRQRVPCTLGYHFMIRGGRLSCRYYMRSCDLIRHFTDDVYLAARLMQWMCEQIIEESQVTSPFNLAITDLQPGKLHMYIASLHAFTGDSYKLNQMIERVHRAQPNQ